MSKYTRYRVKVEQILQADLLIDAENPEQALKQVEFHIKVGSAKPVWKEGEVYAKDVDTLEE
jgi:hypothetical protein